MAAREVVNLDVEHGDEIEIEVPKEPIRIIKIDNPGPGPIDPIKVLSRHGGVLLRRSGVLLFEGASHITEFEIRPRRPLRD